MRVALPVRMGRDSPETAHDTGGDAAGQAQWAAHRHDQAPDPEVVDVAVDGGLGDRPIGPDDREVGERVTAHDLEPGDTSVAERGLPGVGVADHVGVGDQVALGGQGHRGAGRLAGATTAPDPDRRHSRQQHLGHAGDDLGVRIQRVVLGWFHRLFPCS